jgi:hypothetical protein
MSTWTHVVGCLRIDGIPQINPMKWNVREVEKAMSPMPVGSEGGLQYRVIEYSTGAPWVAVAIWGDLRDFDDVESVREWWLALQAKFDLVRDGALQIQVEGRDPVILGNTQKG